MLRGIHPALSPDLLAALHRMGHGDELILADAHFPGESLGPPVLRADGADVATPWQELEPGAAAWFRPVESLGQADSARAAQTPPPTATQRVCDAVLASARMGEWVEAGVV